MKEEKLTCDCCGQVIERYSASPTYSHIETYPKEYIHNGTMHLVHIEPEPIRHICRECWGYFKRFFIQKDI